MFWWTKKFGVESKKLKKLGKFKKLGAEAGAGSSLVEVS